MDYQYTTSELSASGVPESWSVLCEKTAQHQLNQGSAWDTLVEKYSDTQEPARWEILTPMALERAVAGPTSLPTGFPEWPTVSVTNTLGSPSLKQLTLRRADNTAYSGVNVTLQKANGEVIEQGFTDTNGELVIYGAEIGDQLRVAAFQDGIAASIPITDDNPIDEQLGITRL